ncbi:hypothetical protein FJT64_011905 [Amphibalanus amphitrite]|uniref:F-box domain-containing protein n=1 Tax=Amphibalanus amphitrite TaxID=1232801 RepID=A0A6A4VKJ9_AMPAM|nr:uncharacterized protein LOC122369712 isoform X2 [Amphibalanus amphitrite]KAF0289901.1 hypothetical protein FJT64_011905 [Amphibalanus amphitrite]
MGRRKAPEKIIRKPFILTKDEPDLVLEDLPTEMLFRIMRFLAIDDLYAIRMASPRLYSVAGAEVRRRHFRTLMYTDKSLPAVIDDAKLAWMVSNMPQLQTINLGRVTPECQPLSLGVIAEHCSSLRRIDFRRFRFTRGHFEKLIANCPNLLKRQYGVRFRMSIYEEIDDFELQTCVKITRPEPEEPVTYRSRKGRERSRRSVEEPGAQRDSV